MISGTTLVGRVVEESICRSSEDYRFTEIKPYKIHSNALMPDIKFEEAMETPESIKHSVFLNDTRLKLSRTIKVQNYLSTRYIGRIPLEFYSDDGVTKMGRKFILICREGNPNENYRSFGTEQAIRGGNPNASDMIEYPDGGNV